MGFRTIFTGTFFLPPLILNDLVLCMAEHTYHMSNRFWNLTQIGAETIVAEAFGVSSVLMRNRRAMDFLRKAAINGRKRKSLCFFGPLREVKNQVFVACAR
jgi:hypothetical protein